MDWPEWHYSLLVCTRYCWLGDHKSVAWWLYFFSIHMLCHDYEASDRFSDLRVSVCGSLSWFNCSLLPLTNHLSLYKSKWLNTVFRLLSVSCLLLYFVSLFYASEHLHHHHHLNGHRYNSTTRMIAHEQGWMPAYWRLGPHTVLSLLLIERVRAYLGLKPI